MAKKIGFDCVTCRKWRGKACEQFMADLPNSRLAVNSDPFTNCSVDYLGPVIVKYSRKARTKGYGVVFTCMTTRCIHLEFATDISTDVFLLAFDRFISTYGQPHEMVSDNGKNFKGASRIIKKLLKSWNTKSEDSKKLSDFCAQYNIKWRFVTPKAPHHNGVTESMVKSVKTAMKKMVNNAVLTEEEYRTVFAKITATINSRPIFPASDGNIEEPMITCQDLLRPSTLNHDPPALNVDDDPRKRVHRVNETVNMWWWKVWLRNFLPSLQLRNKWWKDRSNIEVGDLVLVIDPDVKRGCWNMGKVLKVYPDDDGRVRSVKVKTVNGQYDRPITRLTLLLARKEYEG